MSRVSIIFGKHMLKGKAGGETKVFFAVSFIKKNIIIIFICLFNIYVVTLCTMWILNMASVNSYKTAYGNLFLKCE